AYVARVARPVLPGRAEPEYGNGAQPCCRLDRLSRRHQGQHAFGAEQNGVAAGGARQDRLPDDLSSRSPGGPALLDERDSAGVQEDLNAFSTGLSIWPAKVHAGTCREVQGLEGLNKCPVRMGKC